VLGIGGDTKCRYCGSKDHASDNCPHDHGVLGIGGDTKCRYCGSKNHASDNCPHDHGVLGIGGDTKCRHCGSNNHASDNCPHRNYHYTETASSSSSQEDNDWLILVAVLAAIGFVIWLIFFVAIPLVVINMAAIALIGGVIKKNRSNILFPVSILGAIFVVADYNRGWVSGGLVREVAFLGSWIRPMLYANLLAGLIAAYLSIRHVLNTRTPPPVGESEFSKKNLIVIGCLSAVGATTVGVQMYVDTHAQHSKIVTNSQVSSSPTRSSVPAEARSSTQMRGSQTSTAPSSKSASKDTAGSTTPDIAAGSKIRGENESCSKNSECAVGLNCVGSVCQKPVSAERPRSSQAVSRTDPEKKLMANTGFGALGSRCTEQFECGGGLKCEAGICMAREATGIAEAQPKPPSRSSTDAEREAWKAAVGANKVTSYEAYLKEYPSGRHASAARVKIAGLKAEPTPRPDLAAVSRPVPAVSPAGSTRVVGDDGEKAGKVARYVDKNGCLREANGSFVIGFRSDCR